jgi:hypothetical protein
MKDTALREVNRQLTKLAHAMTDMPASSCDERECQTCRREYIRILAGLQRLAGKLERAIYTAPRKKARRSA